jgi:hypothetical protein
MDVLDAMVEMRYGLMDDSGSCQVGSGARCGCAVPEVQDLSQQLGPMLPYALLASLFTHHLTHI